MSLFTRDLLERVVRTAIATFAGSLAATQSYDEAGVVTAITTMLTAVLSLLASQFGNPESASFMD